MSFLLSLTVSIVAVIILVLLPWLGVWGAGLQTLFGIVIPYAAAAIFFVGLIYRILKWSQSPVPFRIPTTCGQEKSLSWIKPNKIDNPTSTGAVTSAAPAAASTCGSTCWR